MKIAIDGPAGAGKSTLARRLAGLLGYVYIDTGAMYRALTLYAWQNNLDIDNEQLMAQAAANITIDLQAEGENLKVYLSGEDVTEAIRQPQISEKVSVVATYPSVRKIMVEKQQHLANRRNVVMDGRDIGECVLPDAEYKFYITASLEERARRRAAELKSKGYDAVLLEVEEELRLRDYQDSNRQIGALKLLPDAVLIDTSNMDEEDVLRLVVSRVEGEK